MKYRVEITGQEEEYARLRKVAKIVTDAAPAYRAAGLAALQVFSNIFKERGSRFGGWKQPGVWTKLLRAKPGRKFSTLKEVESADMNPLQDTGIGRASFSESHPEGVFDIAGNHAYVGSRVKYMDTHNKGGTSKFKFGPEQETRLESNLRKTLDGGKPKTTPTGRKSRAKKNWNPVFFITRAAMRKADGKSFTVKQRRIEPEDNITHGEMQNIYRAFEMELMKLVEGI